jgi:hypothetical protein
MTKSHCSKISSPSSRLERYASPSIRARTKARKLEERRVVAPARSRSCFRHGLHICLPRGCGRCRPHSEEHRRQVGGGVSEYGRATCCVLRRNPYDTRNLLIPRTTSEGAFVDVKKRPRNPRLRVQPQQRPERPAMHHAEAVVVIGFKGQGVYIVAPCWRAVTTVQAGSAPAIEAPIVSAGPTRKAPLQKYRKQPHAK